MKHFYPSFHSVLMYIKSFRLLVRLLKHTKLVCLLQPVCFFVYIFLSFFFFPFLEEKKGEKEKEKKGKNRNKRKTSVLIELKTHNLLFFFQEVIEKSKARDIPIVIDAVSLAKSASAVDFIFKAVNNH